MKNKTINIITLTCLMFLFVSCWQKGKSDKMPDPRFDPTTLLWYDHPAEKWEDALPVGNGRLGAMVFGKTDEERIQFNEDTYWSGGPYSTTVKGGNKMLPEIQKLVFENKDIKAHNLFGRYLMGYPVEQMKYQSMGDLIIKFPYEGEVNNYKNQLNINKAITTVSYRQNEIDFTREVFSSYDNQVIVVRLTANKPGSISFRANLRGCRNQAHSNYATDYFFMDGYGDDGLSLKGKSADYMGVEGKLKYFARLKAVPEGGNMRVEEADLIIENADVVTLYLAAATNFVNYKDVSADQVGRVNKVINSVENKNYFEIRNNHIRNHQGLFNRVSIDLGSSENSFLPTDQRLKNFNGQNDPNLAALCLQYGRYLLISSSRPGTQPANLQGIWNEDMNPSWDSKYTTNINTEMNYWPAEVGNLGELTQPLFQMIRDLSEQGANVAKEHYGAGGWVYHQNTDLWRVAAPMDGPAWGAFPTGGTWLCTHIWEHFLFTGDTLFLEEYFSLLKGNVEFFMDFLVEHPDYGWLVTNPSSSPENFPLHPGNDRFFEEITGSFRPGTSICAGPTIDMQLLNDFFGYFILASEILNDDPDFRIDVEEARSRLAPMQIGKNGDLQEWLEDWGQREKSHRHISNLYGLYPGNQISAKRTPVFAEGARVVLEQRGVVGNGWASAWKMGCWARLFNAEKVIENFDQYIHNYCFNSLYANCQGSMQVDGSFGVSAAIAEMLIQSHENEIKLLPALPESWANGEYKGLCARGNFVIDVEWGNGKLSKANILSRSGSLCRLKTSEKVKVYSDKKEIILTENVDGSVEFQTTKNSLYQIVSENRIQDEELALLVGIKPVNLKCEYQQDPFGIDNKNPMLSWQVKSNERGQIQTAYQIIVADNINSIKKNSGNIWKSRKIKTKQSENILFDGATLKSGRDYYWKVRLWDKNHNKSEWSEAAKWEMALLENSDWEGFWISDGKTIPENSEDFYKEDPAPLYRKEIHLKKQVRKARLYISGLGYYEAEINGERVGNNVLDPAWTNYSKRVFYSAYDVTSLLNEGQNCIGVGLGNGWYNPLPMKMWGNNNLRTSLPVGRPCFVAQINIKYEDGSKASFFTDDSWKFHDGPIIRNNVYLGEMYDARKVIPGWSNPGINDKSWKPAEIISSPTEKLQAQPLPPIKATKVIVPKKVTNISPGVYIFDMGENFAGWITLYLKGEKGRRIKIRYGELLNENGSLNVMTSVAGQIKREGTGGPGSPDIAWQEDNYILKGSGDEIFIPRFTFHGFRYVEITNFPGLPSAGSLTGYRLNTDLETAGSFSCSNDLLNTIQEITLNTFLSNIFSVQSDCPHREKFGYGGDLAATCDAFMMNFNMNGFYSKAVYDWADAARPDGMFTDEAPFVGIQYCGVGWALVHPLLLNKLYQYYGNKRIIEEQYGNAKKWFDLVISQNPDFIIKSGLSDHEGLEPAPSPQMVTPLYFYSAKLMSNLASILEKKEDKEEYNILAENIREKYIEEFLEPGTGKFSPETQASQSFALWMDLVPENERIFALDFLKDKISNEHDNHLSTGIYGTKFLLDILSSSGNIDLAYKIVNQKTFPGWGFMIENDATTLWEHWAFSDNTYSHNHPMFGSVSEWFYKWLGGIQPDPEAVGFDKIIIQPQLAAGLDWVNSEYNSVKGIIKSNWVIDNGVFKHQLTVPPNSTATLYLPADNPDKVMEGGEPVSDAEAVTFIKYEGGAAVYKIGSGEFFFESNLSEDKR